jgi:hypothetical protein
MFNFWQRLGVNVTRKHFYSPIPDTRELARKDYLWDKPSELPGVNMNPDIQLQHLEEFFPEFKSELNFPVDKTNVPCEYYLNNPAYGIIDASVLHCMIRHYHPKTIIEVGSGNSTLVAARAALLNRDSGCSTKLISIEPYPRELLTKGFPGLDCQIPRKVEDVEISVFQQLQRNDILFIDSSHVVRTGNDVLYLYLEVLPRLNPGVIVHIHDIFFPYDYPRRWVVENHTFWTEQYLLHAFLCCNNKFEVLFGNYFMKSKFPDKMNCLFAAPAGYRDRHNNSSFWIRKTD